jgi:hypothetical protein
VFVFNARLTSTQIRILHTSSGQPDRGLVSGGVRGCHYGGTTLAILARLLSVLYFDFRIALEYFFLQILSGIVAQFIDDFVLFVVTDCRFVKGVTFTVS